MRDSKGRLKWEVLQKSAQYIHMRSDEYPSMSDFDALWPVLVPSLPGVESILFLILSETAAFLRTDSEGFYLYPDEDLT
jgi:hypothetical protein